MVFTLKVIKIKHIEHIGKYIFNIIFSLALNFQLLSQQPHAPQVDQYFHVFPPHPNTFFAQLKFSGLPQGGLPPLH
jgi:hypothetical protein